MNSCMAQSSKFGMGTVIMNQVYGEGAAEALKAAEKETERLEMMLSRFIENSEISTINRYAGLTCVKVGCDTFEVLLRAVEFSQSCQGCFDVTIGPLVDLWKVSKGASQQPEEQRIGAVLPLVDYTSMILDSLHRTVRLKRKGQSIDLGGIGKGFAADMVLRVYMKLGIKSAYTNLGGNVAVLGTKPDGSAWRIGIQHPRKEIGLIGAVSVCNKSVVTSGDYQRFFIDSGGKKYHHILDSKTGYPADSGLTSVTVIADDSITADALSTILFVSGKEKGLKILKGFPGAEAIFIDENLLVHIPNSLKDSFLAADGIKTNILNN